MKHNRIRTLWIAAVLCAALLLTSCGDGTKLSGKYAAKTVGSGVTYEFSGNKVTITGSALGMDLVSVSGTYTIDGDKITFSFAADESGSDAYSGTFDFKSDENSITIGLITYQKQN
ncbi:MAG TPA: hypothetical protein DCE08_05320 [Ruminococcaceae bacterium]|nr:hypothetical protein [Oscillospiraceae bacterium]